MLQLGQQPLRVWVAQAEPGEVLGQELLPVQLGLGSLPGVLPLLERSVVGDLQKMDHDWYFSMEFMKLTDVVIVLPDELCLL